MRFLLLIVLLFICGCSGMSNDEIIAEVKRCKDAGLKYDINRKINDSKVASVTCK